MKLNELILFIQDDLARYSFTFSRFKLIKAIITSPGFRAVMVYRIQSYCTHRDFTFLAHVLYGLNISKHGLDLVPGCKIGRGLVIQHPVGIVIGSGAAIGDNCTILQGVSVGVRNVSAAPGSHVFPKIGDRVVLSADSIVLGDVVIGDDSVVGAQSLVLKSFPSNSTILGSPAQ